MAEKILKISVILIVVIIITLIATSCSCGSEKQLCVHCGCELKTNSEKEAGICGGCLSTINSRCDNVNYNYNER